MVSQYVCPKKLTWSSALNALVIENPIDVLLNSWGLAGIVSSQLEEHARLVSSHKGSRVGEIVRALGIVADDFDIERVMSSKPEGALTLDWLRESIPSLSTKIEQVLAIQNGIAFLSRAVPELNVHPMLYDKNIFNDEFKKEINTLNLLPLQYGNRVILIFGDITKLQQFQSHGKDFAALSPLCRAMFNLTGQRVTITSSIPSILVDNGVMIAYRQSLTEASEGKVDASDAIQTIYQHEADTDDVMASVIRILNEAIQLNVNDVAVIPDPSGTASKVFFRKFQRLQDSRIMLSAAERDPLIRVLMARSRANDSGGRLLHPVDGNLNFNGKAGQAFLRLSFIPLESSQGDSISASIRVLPRTSKKIDMATLRIAEELQTELMHFVRGKFGLFLVCGPTGSGKSTTIASMLCAHHDLYGDTQKRISVEEPCERKLPGVMHIDVSQHRYVGEKRSGDTFASALRYILRHDPDVIFVGEVRDRESCGVSVDAANTGHLVLTTTHANDPVLGYRRLASFLTEDRQFDLVNVLEGILAQRLVTTVCQKCSDEMAVDDDVMDKFKRYGEVKGIDMDKVEMPSVYRAASKRGCDECSGGYSGMVPVHGLLTMNPTVRALLLSPDETQWMKAQGASNSKFTLFGSAMKLFRAGLVDLDGVLL